MLYQFGSFELDLDRQELFSSGAAQTIEPQVFDLLVLLVSRAGDLITHDDLIATVWKGRIVSDSAISARISAARAAIGDSGSRQQMIKTVPRKGFRFVADVTVHGSGVETIQSVADAATAVPAAQRVRYCASKDGTQIAYASTGTGMTFVRTGHWLTHLEHDWHSPIFRPFLDRLGETFAITRYDQRGNGLSEWSVDSWLLDRCVEDLEAVVDAAGLDRFVLFGTSQGAPISIAYAARHPERISHLVLLGGYAKGRLVRGDTEAREEGKAILTLIRHSWGKSGSAFLKGFSSMYIPNATPEQVDSLVDLQRSTTSPENAASLREAVDTFDVTEILDQVNVPTLVLHARNDSVQPLDQGRVLASGIRNAQFVMLESDNHVILPHEPAWDILFNELISFVTAT